MLTSYLNQILELKDYFSEDLRIVDHYIKYYISKFIHFDIGDLKFMMKGKRVRSLMFLKFWNSKGDPNLKYKTLALLEVIHSASLIHDDVVDHAKSRRRAPSFFDKFGSKISVLTGDYLLICAIKEFLNIHKNDDFAKICFLREINSTAYGALLEQRLSINSTIHESLKVAKLKTASIFKLSAFLGSYLSSPENCESSKKAASFGTIFGLAFQFQNDLDAYRYEHFKESEDYLEKNVTTPILIVRDYIKPDLNPFLEQNQKNYHYLQDILTSEVFVNLVRNLPYFQYLCNRMTTLSEDYS